MRRFVLMVSGLALSLILLAPDAVLAGATFIPFTESFTDAFTVEDGCTGKVGTLTGTGTVSGRVIQTPSLVEHHPTEYTFDYRVDFGDGSHLISTDHQKFRLHVDEHDDGVYSSRTRDVGTLYDVDGSVTGSEMFLGTFHGIVVDGQLETEFEYGRLICFSEHARQN